MDTLTIALVLIALPMIASASAAASAGGWARYDMLSTVERKAPPVSDVTITIGPTDGSKLRWWEMSAAKASGERFAIRLLSERVPITGAKDAPGRIVRYILREGDNQPIEYVDARTGGAFLPKFEFITGLLPQPMPRARIEHGFAVTGTCMGHVLSLAETGDAAPWADWPKPTVLRLNPDEMQYVYGLARDTEGHYISEGDYTYVPLDHAEIDQLVDLGMNTFWVDDNTEDWLYRRSVLYYKQFSEKSKLNYPEILYRSNYRGGVVFIDEPAIHLLGDRADLDRVKRPEDGALLLTKRVEETWNRPSPGKWRQGLLREQLDACGANPGTLALVDDDHPLWETITETSFYQLQGGTQGIVHEGRYQLKDFEHDCERYLGPGVELTPKEMLLLDYAYMRGAARAFGKDWGVAIYGQCDPEIAPLALTLAYDMGARYMWFWTYDHQHHLPHYMKLKLLKALQEHKASRPRGPIDKLRDAPRTAIVMPYGYGWILDFYMLWDSKNLKVTSPNAAGVPHSEVIAAIVASGIACAKAGEDFDYVVDTGQEMKGYKRVMRVELDGSVTDSKPAPPPTKLSANIVVGKPELADTASPVVSIPYKNGLRIDGDLTKWSDANWLTVDKPEQFVPWKMSDGKEGTYGGPSDLSASVAFAADEEFLYVAARITDDHFSQTFTGESIWRGDSIQVALDPRLDRARGYSTDDIEFGLALTSTGPEAWLWKSGPGVAPGPVKGATVSIKPGNSGRMIYEAAIPWASITSMPPQFIDRCGISFVVNDDDGAGRKGTLEFTPGIAHEKDPSTFALASVGPIPPAAGQAATVLPDDSRRIACDGRWQVALDALASSRRSCQLSVTLASGKGKAAEGTFPVEVPAGRSRVTATLDAAGLKAGVYRCELVLKSGARKVAGASYPVYVLR